MICRYLSCFTVSELILKIQECRVDSFIEAKIGDASLEKGFLTKFAKLNVES